MLTQEEYPVEGCELEFDLLNLGDDRLNERGKQIAHRLSHQPAGSVTHMNRAQPERSCDEVLEAHEWKPLYCKIHGTNQVPEKPPTARQAIRWIAHLGGFLGRKRDGEPGLITIGRGWKRLQDLSDAWLTFGGAQQ